jgi:predicted phage-related endonuclease
MLGASDRRSWIGGSDANVILSADRERILRLWREKRGEAEPENLTGSLAVMLGCWTEAFNRQWFERLTGEQVREVGQSLVCNRHSWRRCTLDGRVQSSGAVWEAKHTSAFAKSDEVLERYMPQLQHNMAVAGAETAILSVIFGNHRYECIEVASDWLYQLELLEAEEQFWDCVVTGKEPVPVESPPSPKPIGTREVCLEGNNAWASAACDWLTHREVAKTHASACVVIKSLVERDVCRAFGHGIEAKRSRSGAITIRELAQ